MRCRRPTTTSRTPNAIARFCCRMPSGSASCAGSWRASWRRPGWRRAFRPGPRGAECICRRPGCWSPPPSWRWRTPCTVALTRLPPDADRRTPARSLVVPDCRRPGGADRGGSLSGQRPDLRAVHVFVSHHPGVHFFPALGEPGGHPRSAAFYGALVLLESAGVLHRPPAVLMQPRRECRPSVLDVAIGFPAGDLGGDLVSRLASGRGTALGERELAAAIAAWKPASRNGRPTCCRRPTS